MAAGHGNSALAGPFTYSFTSLSSPGSSAAAFVPAGAAPVLIATTPADAATEALVSADLVATFSEPVVAGTGIIELWQDGGGSPVESFDVASSPRLTLTGSTLAIDPTADLLPDTAYHVTILATAILDVSGNAFAGLAGDTDWNFTTRATATAITVVNTSGGLVQSNPPPTRTWSFDAGATADMLIVACSGELGNAVAGASIQITYAGFPMTRAIGSIYAAVFYLDLTTSPYAGGAANLVVDLSDYGSRNGLGIGAVSVNSGDSPVAVRTGSGNSADVSTNGTLVETCNAAISSHTGGNNKPNTASNTPSFRCAGDFNGP